jgi:predicted membrane-bound spermidine synthase
LLSCAPYYILQLSLYSCIPSVMLDQRFVHGFVALGLVFGIVLVCEAPMGYITLKLVSDLVALVALCGVKVLPIKF